MDDKMYELVCYMTTSAKSLIEEPKDYAPARMMDSLQRLLRLQDEENISKELLNKIEDYDFFKMDQEEMESALDEIIEILLGYD